MSTVGNLKVVVEADASKVQAELSKATSSFKSFQKAAQDSSHGTVNNVQAISAAIRELENPINGSIRAVERFVAQSQTLSKVLVTAFPLFGAAALTGMVAKLGTEFNDFIRKVNDAPKAITSAFQSMTVDTESSTDSMQLHLLKTQDAISKLLGKPETNGAAEALTEMKIAADELSKSLTNDAGKLKSLMEANKIGTAGAFFTGKAGTAEAQGTISSYEDKFTDLGYQYQQALQKGNTAAADDLKKQLKDAMTSAHEKAQQEIANRRQNQTLKGAYNQSANISLFEGFDQSVQDRLANMNVSSAVKSADAQLAALRGNGGTSASPDNDLASRLKFRDQMVKNFNRSQSEDTTQLGSQNKLGAEMGASQQSAIDEQLKKLQKSTADTAKYQDELADIMKKGADAAQEQAIGIDVASGKMSAYAGAVQMAALHTKEYNEQLEALKAQQAAADSIGDTQESQRIGKQIAGLDANRPLQSASDNAAIGSQFQQSIDKYLGPLNQAILNPSKGAFKQAGASIFSDIANNGLKKAENGVLGMFGLGKQDGSATNPLYVRIAGGGIPGLGSGSGAKGIMGALIGMLPHFAEGGDINAGQLSLVGEKGVELFQPKASGTILSNDKLKKLGGGDTHNYHIDARGATDPAATARMVRQAIQQAAPHIAGAAVKHQSETKRRTPSMSRR